MPHLEVLDKRNSTGNMQMKYDDIYFLSSQEALRVASQQNRWGENNYYLQVCYYEGEKIDSDLPNLIHLPIENLLEELAYGKYRIPEVINFEGLELSSDVKLDILLNFNLSIKQANMYRLQLNEMYLNSLKNASPDFSEPLRFYISASSSTQVMQYISKSIADTLKAMNYDVLFELYVGIEDAGCFKNILEYNPHATININHFNNQFLSKDVFNFVWFQDYMDVLKSNEKIYARERDFVFHLLKFFGDVLEQKGVKSLYQPFCMDETKFKKREEIKKEKKIVFIGSSYSYRVKDLKKDYIFGKIFEEALRIFEKKSCLTSLEHEESDIRYLMDKYNKSEKYISDIYAYLTRDYCVEKLCSIKTDYEVEVYGFGWENNSKISPYFKGKVEYGEETSKIYNNAVYGYCPGGYVLMQRTLECAFSDTVPLVLDVREDLGSEYDKTLDESVEFFHINKLEDILKKEAYEEKRFDYIKEQYGYEHFVKRCLDIIDEVVGGNRG